MPKMPENEAKEETAESIAEKKEQVKSGWLQFELTHQMLWQERLKAQEAKRIEKERNEKYQKLKAQVKFFRGKII